MARHKQKIPLSLSGASIPILLLSSLAIREHTQVRTDACHRDLGAYEALQKFHFQKKHKHYGSAWVDCIQSQMCSSQSVFSGGLRGSVHRTKVTCAMGKYEFPDAGTQVKLCCLNMVTGLGTEKYLGT